MWFRGWDFNFYTELECLGFTQRRADWLTKWSREVAAAAPVVNMASFEEGLGRVMYVVSALECERPFLAPLYRFMTDASSWLVTQSACLCAFHLELHCRRSIRNAPLSLRFSSVESNVFPPSGRASK